DQPIDGSRRLCESGSSSPDAAEPKKATKEPQAGLSTRSAEAAARTPRAATGSTTEAKYGRVAERAEEIPKSATSAQAGAQCNVNLCAAKYASFHAADCTYQPYDGGPRRICER